MARWSIGRVWATFEVTARAVRVERCDQACLHPNLEFLELSFPTADMVHGEMLFYRLSGIATKLNETLEDLALIAEVGHMPSLQQYIKVPLTEGGAVMLVWYDRWPGAWVLMWPQGHDVVQTAWPLALDETVLIDLVMAVIGKCVDGGELPSPYRWGQVERSGLVVLADHLLAYGVPESAIGLDPLRRLDDDGKVRYGGASNELRVTDNNDEQRSLVVQLHEDIGWTVDQVMQAPGASGRLDLASALGLKPALPRVSDEDLDTLRLARVLADDTSWSDDNDDDDPRCLFLYGEAPEVSSVVSRDDAERAAAAWLKWAGFVEADSEVRGGRILSRAIELHVVFSGRPVPLSGVQRCMGIASVSGRTPVIVAKSGFSRNGSEWADVAGMLLFVIGDDGILHAANGLARSHEPPAMGPRPEPCYDEACLSIGCVLDDEYCSSLVGRRRHPDADRWRLI